VQDRLKKNEKDAVKQFQSFTQCPDEKYAIKTLQKFRWNVENAIADYFDTPPAEDEFVASAIGASKLDTLFDKYKGWLVGAWDQAD